MLYRNYFQLKEITTMTQRMTSSVQMGLFLIQTRLRGTYTSDLGKSVSSFSVFAAEKKDRGMPSANSPF